MSIKASSFNTIPTGGESLLTKTQEIIEVNTTRPLLLLN